MVKEQFKAKTQIYDWQTNNGEFVRAAKDKKAGLGLPMIGIGGDGLAKG